jgi:AraC-like DNA-binding protein
VAAAGHDSASAPLAPESGSAAEAVDVVNLEIQAHADEPADGADTLAGLLREVRLTGALFFFVDERSPYAAAAPSGARLVPAILPGAQSIVSYHLVRDGRCWFSLPPGGEGAWLEKGDVLVIPHGDPYELSNPREARSHLSLEDNLEFFRRMAARELPSVIGDGGREGEGDPFRLVCGFLGCDLLPFNPALATLPPALVVRAGTSGESGGIGRLVDLVIAEASARRAGDDGVLRRLGELLFVEVIRRHLAALPPRGNGWLAGLRDPVVGRALARLHARPGEAWTLARLALEAGASRTTLAGRFAAFVGQPPMQYLTRWRIQLAARRLADDRDKVSAVAHAVGYASEAAFSRAFKKATGIAPGDWRDGRRPSRVAAAP